ncbi:hypothetical protein OG249_36135 [Streptomyces microflavus]|uniref:hypothetical protein n=1 Tax=Streptomyces microflavus TaxID=1919 RepID=UPI002250B72D|nr:hypothetical protein [Streptomyces microflavus]MCX4657293.1 hypothetical protein [Streptomyces microflavus]
MNPSPARSTWAVETVRASDLTDSDTVKIQGVWREIFDVWRDTDDPAAMFGENNPTTVAILARTDWVSPCWIGVRYVNEDRSTGHEVEDALHFFRLRTLVEVQKEVPPARRLPPRGRPRKPAVRSFSRTRRGAVPPRKP